MFYSDILAISIGPWSTNRDHCIYISILHVKYSFIFFSQRAIKSLNVIQVLITVIYYIILYLLCYLWK